MGSAEYAAMLGVNGEGAGAAEQLGVPFVALIKAMYGGVLPFEQGVTRLRLAAYAQREGGGARAAGAVVVPTRVTADAVARRYRVDPTRVHVIPEPFFLDEWRAALPQVGNAGPRVLCVAHLYPRKRIADLLDAWPRVVAERPDARLDVVGGGSELRRLVRRAAGLPGCFLHGHVGHPAILEFYARAAVFCLPSAQETFGYAAVEAMATGLPLVIPDSGALAEVCTGAVMETHPVGDAPAIAAAILRSFQPETRRNAADLNPERTRAFDPALVADRLIAVVAAARG
jgi:teichuronic acid biosynthesis glycosyltransferase TuaC